MLHETFLSRQNLSAGTFLCGLPWSPVVSCDLRWFPVACFCFTFNFGGHYLRVVSRGLLWSCGSIAVFCSKRFCLFLGIFFVVVKRYCASSVIVIHQLCYMPIYIYIYIKIRFAIEVIEAAMRRDTDAPTFWRLAFCDTFPHTALAGLCLSIIWPILFDHI